MRVTSIASVHYDPAPVPADITDPALRRYLQEMQERIAATFALLAAGHLDPTYKAPAKPRRGDIRYADGTQWNPGSGEGAYLFKSTGTWAFLG
jgi:hypothetical protein